MKLHFSSEGFNAPKYGFKTGASEGSFLKRRDQWHFHKACDKYPNEKDFIRFCLASLIEDHSWIGDMFEHDPFIYNEWEARFERRSYQFEKDIKFLLSSGKKFNEVFLGEDQKPYIITCLLAEEISIETVVMFNKLTGNVNKMPEFDQLLWPATRLKLLKYGSFIKIDRDDLTKKVEKALQNAYK